MKILLAQEIQNNVHTIDGGVLMAAIENDPIRAESKQKTILDTRVTFKKSMEQLEKLENTKKGKALIGDIKEFFDIIQMSIDTVLQAYNRR